MRLNSVNKVLIFMHLSVLVSYSSIGNGYSDIFDVALVKVVAKSLADNTELILLSFTCFFCTDNCYACRMRQCTCLMALM